VSPGHFPAVISWLNPVGRSAFRALFRWSGQTRGEYEAPDKEKDDGDDEEEGEEGAVGAYVDPRCVGHWPRLDE
jgi:hypothetical protein